MKLIIMTLTITTLTMIFIGFSVNAGEKSKYFAKKCLNHLYKQINSNEEEIVSNSIKYFKLRDLRELRDKRRDKGQTVRCDRTDGYLMDNDHERCMSNYGMCMKFQTKKPWGEIQELSIECYMDANGHVNIGIPFVNRIKKCFFLH